MRRKSVLDNDIVELFAFVGLIIAGFVYLLDVVLGICKVDMPQLFSALRLIRDLSFAIGVGIAAFKFTRGRKAWIKVIFWIALIAYLGFAVFGVFRTV